MPARLTTLHPLLKRHMKRAGIDAAALPDDAAPWLGLLERVSKTYTESDQDRYLLERSMALSSKEMRELHEQLAAERDTLKTVIRSLAEGVCALDAEGKVLSINPEALRLLGLAEEACLGRPLAELADVRDASGATLFELLRAGADRGVGGEDSRLFVAGREAAFIVYSLRPLHGGGGAVLTLRDISERKRGEAEREELNKRLVAASRQAGMAEVAIGVLHNVGNVLNSVNVSASLLEGKLRGSRVKSLAKVAALLEEHAHDLGAYFTGDEKGRQLPGYLRRLSEHLASEQEQSLGELEQLAKNVEHIKQIVSTQQSYTRSVALAAPASATELMEDALRITAASLDRHRIKTERRYGEVPPIVVDKHKVLQILVNLVNNAKQALNASGRPEKHLALEVCRHAERVDVLVMRVSDDGVGIPAENMPRIFEHGFTTRRNGHGFGLHSSALAAKAMKGMLRAHSAGPGAGATFTLELPIQ